jgi:hypothetical protein
MRPACHHHRSRRPQHPRPVCRVSVFGRTSTPSPAGTALGYAGMWTTSARFTWTAKEWWGTINARCVPQRPLSTGCEYSSSTARMLFQPPAWHPSGNIVLQVRFRFKRQAGKSQPLPDRFKGLSRLGKYGKIGSHGFAATQGFVGWPTDSEPDEGV